MIVSYRLLKEYVDLQGLSLKEVCDALTLAGFELEGIETLVSELHLLKAQLPMDSR